MESVEQIAFKIIAASGDSFSLLIEAMKLAREGDFEKAEAKVKEADIAIRRTRHGRNRGPGCIRLHKCRDIHQRTFYEKKGTGGRFPYMWCGALR